MTENYFTWAILISIYMYLLHTQPNFQKPQRYCPDRCLWLATLKQHWKNYKWKAFGGDSVMTFWFHDWSYLSMFRKKLFLFEEILQCCAQRGHFFLSFSLFLLFPPLPSFRSPSCFSSQRMLVASRAAFSVLSTNTINLKSQWARGL